MNVLVNTVSVQFGSLRYDTHVTALTADLAVLPGVNTVTVTLPPQVSVDAAPGDDAVIKINNGEGSQSVLTGQVIRVAKGPRRTQVTAADAGALLSSKRIAQSYQDLPPGEVLRKIADEISIDAISLLTALDPMPIYAAAQSRTVGEHVAFLAELGGGYAHVDADGKLNAQPWPFLPPDRALLQGREVIDYAATSHTPNVDLAFVGSSPAAAGADPRAMSQTTDPVNGGADSPGPSLHWMTRPMLRSGLGVSAAADGARGARAARQSRMQATCWCLPGLRPGSVIEVQGVDDGVSGGPWLLTSVKHTVRRDTGGVTRIAGVSAEGPSLLGGLSDLAGGLFG